MEGQNLQLHAVIGKWSKEHVDFEQIIKVYLEKYNFFDKKNCIHKYKSNFVGTLKNQ